ncbi:MAG: YgiT-type zinc finger protein [Deltaproteobacteria bacterium]|nr:YgiT-type zinc finger protein [Deltaproteobacteria bacterium]MBW2331315.1 YgiT-type zinc finger protein [Deltaproteobacteria bacterium]
MKCAACHNEMVKKKGEIDLRIEEKLYLVRNVSYEECLACGEKILSPKVSQDLFEKIRNRKFVEEIVKIPVLDGTYG